MRRMSCLLPQFKCFPDTFAVNFKSPSNPSIIPSKTRDLFVFRTQCILSATSTPTLTSPTTLLELQKLQLKLLEHSRNSSPPAGDNRSWKIPTSAAVLELENLNLPSLDTDSIPVAKKNPWTYIRDIDRPSEANLGASLSTETLLTTEEVVIAAAASEALALAKTALSFAKDAAMMVSHNNLSDSNPGILQELDNAATSNKSRLGRREYNKIGETEVPYTDSDETELSAEELEILEAQLSKSRSLAVRSERQTERKARRSRAAERAASNIVSVKSGSTSKKKRAPVQEVDYADPLRYLRGTTNTSKLLTASEEHVLSAGIQVLLKLERLQEELTERCGGPPTIHQWAAAAGVDQKTLREQINYGTLCKDKMITSNIRLVISIAKNYQGAGMNLQDLVQEGCRGLVRGAEKFDASKGFKFSTYAHWWIKQAVRKSLSDQSRTIRLPFHMVEATYRVKEARKQLFAENGKHPNNEQVAEATGLSMKRLDAVMLTPKAPRSLDQKIGINQNLKPSEVISDPEAETSEELLIKQFMRQDLAKVLDSLNPREKQVIQWRFGLEDGRMKTLQEIGELMGVSRERIRQIESCAFRKLKNKKRTKHLQQYVMA